MCFHKIAFLRKNMYIDNRIIFGKRRQKMIKFIRNQSLKVSAVAVLAIMSGVDSAYAQDADADGVTFSTLSDNVTQSISGLPGLLAGVSYMIGILLGVLGILKIKDHVENPTQTKLQDGAIRLVAGGGLFALPIVFEAMQGSIGDGTGPEAITINSVTSGFELQ
jgi:hypothetical protein